MLCANVQGKDGIETLPFALSSEIGEAEVYSRGVGSGTNSLSPMSGDTTEKIYKLTLDAFAKYHGIETIDFMKIDTERFDFNVLRGANEMMQAGRIGMLQFEYNWRWLINKASLRDVFELIQGIPYRLGELVGASIEFYPQWYFELDRCFESNYVLVRVGNNLLESANLVNFDSSNASKLANDFSR